MFWSRMLLLVLNKSPVVFRQRTTGARPKRDGKTFACFAAWRSKCCILSTRLTTFSPSYNCHWQTSRISTLFFVGRYPSPFPSAPGRLSVVAHGLVEDELAANELHENFQPSRSPICRCHLRSKEGPFRPRIKSPWFPFYIPCLACGNSIARNALFSQKSLSKSAICQERTSLHASKRSVFGNDALSRLKISKFNNLNWKKPLYLYIKLCLSLATIVLMLEIINTEILNKLSKRSAFFNRILSFVFLLFTSEITAFRP